MVAAMPSSITAIAKRSDGPPGSMIQSVQPLAILILSETRYTLFRFVL
jgi:hypothetical protein